ncbi:MAG: tRNA pseudouridine(55) synthase TruB [Kiritimatiellia bacterium]|nr:tRNA pseudouridine(55) synthase TruB [Kiritimatiellia bacterium]
MPNTFETKQEPMIGEPSLDGVLLVDKPSGPTSHDIVDKIRRHFRLAKVGHAGTLDPQATGLLVIMIGRGTKLANSLMSADKIYEGTLRLGIATDTQDAQGKVMSEADPSQVTEELLTAEMKKLTGDIMQVPPMVSAAKKNGIPLYKLARQGKTVERKPKLVRIYEFTLRSFKLPQAEFFLRCSKGVYARTLCDDIGSALKCGAHLASLRRLRSGEFNVLDACSLEQLMAMDRRQLLRMIIPLNKVINS